MSLFFSSVDMCWSLTAQKISLGHGAKSTTSAKCHHSKYKALEDSSPSSLEWEDLYNENEKVSYAMTHSDK
jgi:hypothetical protein